MRAIMSLLAAGVLLLSGTARAQYGQDPYAPVHPEDDHGYYQPPAEGGGVPAGAFAYAGIHPIPYDVGAGFCTMQTPHQHHYQPFDVNLFRQVGGYYYFVGDPYDFGYAQTLHWYRGHHPVPVEFGDGYCYMTWPHRHHYAPPPPFRTQFRMIGGHFVYMGPWAQPYYQHRDHYTRYYNDYYRSHYYGNRYFRVRPRHVYHPRVGVRVDLPGVSFGVGVPPAPPQVRVYGVPPATPPPAYRAPVYHAPAVVPPPAPAFGGGRPAVVPPPAPAYR